MNDNVLKWVGGKHSLAPFIIEKMHEHNFYIEVFAGAINVFLNKPLAKDGSIINDINGELVNLYRVISNPHLRDAMIEYIRDMPYSRDLFNELKDLYKLSIFQGLGDSFRAAVFIYLNSTSFNGMFESFSHRSSHPYNVHDINDTSKRMFNLFQSGNIMIENLHFRELINGTKQRAGYDKKGVFLYLDPPYWVTTESKGSKYYQYVMTKEEHTELKDILYKIVDAKWLMSYDDIDEIRTLYKEANQPGSPIYLIETNKMYQSSSSRTAEESVYKNELLIANYDLRSYGTLFERKLNE